MAVCIQEAPSSMEIETVYHKVQTTGYTQQQENQTLAENI